jgi:SAM-dependent methyltransferase
VLGLAPNARVFDQCCGIGQLALAFADRGHDVVAVDQAKRYIERARRDAADRRLAVEVHAGDAFEFVPATRCDGAYNWWTSYGYAPTREENVKMLARAFESLRPGGRFALDVPNAPGLFRGFLPHVVTRRVMPEGEIVLVRESELDLGAGVLRKRWTYFLPDGRRVEYPSALLLELPSDVAASFRRVGFDEVTLYGNVRGEPLTLESPRCIVVGRRPA